MSRGHNCFNLQLTPKVVTLRLIRRYLLHVVVREVSDFQRTRPSGIIRYYQPKIEITRTDARDSQEAR